MPWGEKSYNLVQSTNKQKKAPATNGLYTKVSSSKEINPSSSCSSTSSKSSTSSSKGLVHKNNVPKQVKNSNKLKKIIWFVKNNIIEYMSKH